MGRTAGTRVRNIHSVQLSYGGRIAALTCNAPVSYQQRNTSCKEHWSMRKLFTKGGPSLSERWKSRCTSDRKLKNFSVTAIYVANSNINRTILLKSRDFSVNQTQFTGNTYNHYNVFFHIYLRFVSSDHNGGQVVHSAVAKRSTVKFLTKENVKPADILMRLRAQFGNETFSRTQVYDCSKSFKEGRTKVENMGRLHLLQGKLWPAFFGNLKASYSSIFW